jgi:ubiquinone biosynthesis accessory factor UbiJ
VSFFLNSKLTLPDLSPRAMVQLALTRLLQPYPGALAQLAHHSGKTFALVAPPFKGLFTIESTGQVVCADSAIVPDVSIEIDLNKINWSQWADADHHFDIVSVTRVTGDAALAQTLSGLMKTLRPDIEDLLAERLGDVPARNLVKGAKSLHQGLMQSGRRVTENMVEYLSHESRVLTPEVLLHSLSSSLQSFNTNLARLQSRQQQLNEKLEQLSALKKSIKAKGQSSQ